MAGAGDVQPRLYPGGRRAEAPAPEPEPGEPDEAATPRIPLLASPVVAWPVSGRDAEGLAAQAARLARHVAGRPDTDPVDVGWSLAAGRSVFEHRAVVLGGGRDELLACLPAVAAGEPADGVVAGSVPAGGPGRVVFVFPGLGSQWAGMGGELAAVCPVFAARLAECGRALAPYVDWSLEEILAGAEGVPPLERVDVVQPVLWAVMVSLAAVWQAAGVTPDAVAGHSQGGDRGGQRPGRHRRLGRPGCGPGPRRGVRGRRVRARLLPVGYASHSSQVDELQGEILRVLEGIAPVAGQVPMI